MMFWSIFQKSIFDNRVALSSLYVLIKAVFIGIFVAEFWYFGTITANKFLHLCPIEQNKWLISWQGALIAISLFVLLLFYLSLRDFWGIAWKLLKSWRIDILVTLVLGVWINVTWGGILSGYYHQLISSVNLQQLLTLIAIPFVLGLLAIGRVLLQRHKDFPSSLFIPGHELEKEEDLLNFNEKVSSFAESVFNNGATVSFVFGVDAPWGIGKSSYVNFYQRYWEKNYKGAHQHCVSSC